MNTSFLLPNNFKKIGAFLAPAGLLIWSLAQQRFFDSVLVVDGNNSPLVVLLVVSFFSFLSGLYFLTFSKEKSENDAVNKIRLQSFQISTSMQFLLIVASCINSIVSGKEPTVDFLAMLIFAFWLSYIVCFNFYLFKNKKRKLLYS